jgi:hypothetical protein
MKSKQFLGLILSALLFATPIVHAKSDSAQIAMMNQNMMMAGAMAVMIEGSLRELNATCAKSVDEASCIELSKTEFCHFKDDICQGHKDRYMLKNNSGWFYVGGIFQLVIAAGCVALSVQTGEYWFAKAGAGFAALAALSLYGGSSAVKEVEAMAAHKARVSKANS